MGSIEFHPRSFDAEQLLPREAYISPEWFQREREQLFSRYWNFAGSVHELPNPGDYTTLEAGLFPLFVIRGADTRLRAFHNLCRHRGTQFLEGSGNAAHGLVCPYHRWAYNLDGSLRSISQESRLFKAADKQQLGLMEASVGVFRGLIFVHPSPNPVETFSDFVADLEEKIGEHHPDRMIDAGKLEWEFEANWKLVGENYMDAYHLYHIHEKSSAVMDHDAFEWDTAGRHFLFYQPAKAEGAFSTRSKLPLVPDTLERDPRFGGYFHLLFPNLGWVGTAVDFSTFFIKPISHDRTVVETRQFYMPMESVKLERLTRRSLHSLGKRAKELSARPIRIDDFDIHPLKSNDLMLEDMWACRQMQKGLNSPAYRVGPMSWKYEATMTFYQRNIADFVPGRSPVKAVAG